MEYKSVTMDKIPESWDKEIKVVVDNNKIKISSDSIDHIVLWHNEKPDDRCLIRWSIFGDYVKIGDVYQYKQVMDKKKPAKKWFALETKGENMLFWISFSKLKPSKKMFLMEVTRFPYFLEKKTSPHMVCVPRNEFKPSVTRTWLSIFLADDETAVKEVNAEPDLNRNFFNQQAMDSPATFRRITEIYTPGCKE